MNQEIKRGRGFFLGSLCTAHRSGSQLIPHLRQTNINIWIFHFLQTHKSHNMAVIILTYSIIIYAFLHLANALIISDLSSLTSPFRLSLSVCVCVCVCERNINSVQVHYCNFPVDQHWNITCNVQGPCKYFPHRHLYTQVFVKPDGRCLSLQSYLNFITVPCRKLIMREDHD